MLLLPFLSFFSLQGSYFETFAQLREKEAWAEIAILGEESLRGNPSSEEAARIHGHLASSYFYLGQFAPAERHARACYETACRLRNPDEQAHGLYLLSATARARGEFAVAKAIAHLALPLAAGETRAKALFNLGAAEAEDPQGDLAAAEAAYREAASLFECGEDRARCNIRLGKIHLLRGDLSSARALIESTLSTIQNERIRMHATYLVAQIEKGEGNLERAKESGEKALAAAMRLGAKKDAERIRSFLEGL